jgi:putative nucleotidyltransferase with HDIG domain
VIWSGQVVELGTRRCLLSTAIDISERKVLEESLRAAYDQTRRARDATLEALGTITEFRDPYTAGHQREVARIAVAIARHLGLPEVQVEGLREASIVHDIGKIAVPIEILASPGRLSPIQLDLVHAHATSGHEILRNIDFERPVAEIVRQHHERPDGSGYPRGLRGEEIMLEARILAVADIFEAMTSHRPYRPAPGKEAALAELQDGAGTRYDPVVVGALLEVDKQTAPPESRRGA